MLIIPGSGPTNRDGNGPMGLKAATYRLLAQGLAERGIATVRIDKRGMFGSAGAVEDANAVTISDYATDVHSWITSIRKRTGNSCVWLLGHSEGGLVALAASRRAVGICGLVLVATAGRRMADVLKEQLKSNPSNAALLDQALSAIDALDSGRHVDVSTMPSALLPLFRPEVQDFLIDEFAIDPARLVAAFHGPVLIMQGGQDIQVGVPDAERLKRANPCAELLVLPDANHVLKAVASKDRAENILTYGDPSLPLAHGVIDGIARFVASSATAR